MLALALAAISTQSFAGTTTGNFQSTATLSSSCLVSATNVNFGTITPAATGTTAATGTITSTYSKDVSYTLKMSSGFSSDVMARTMWGTPGNTDKLSYNLYTEVAATNIWGDGSGSSVKVNLTGTGTSQSSTVFGQLPLNQYLKPDTYTDNLSVTLAY